MAIGLVQAARLVDVLGREAGVRWTKTWFCFWHFCLALLLDLLGIMFHIFSRVLKQNQETCCFFFPNSCRCADTPWYCYVLLSKKTSWLHPYLLRRYRNTSKTNENDWSSEGRKRALQGDLFFGFMLQKEFCGRSGFEIASTGFGDVRGLDSIAVDGSRLSTERGGAKMLWCCKAFIGLSGRVHCLVWFGLVSLVWFGLVHWFQFKCFVWWLLFRLSILMSVFLV